MKLVCLLFSILLSSPAFSASLSVEQGLDVLAINGTKVDYRKDSFALEDGANQIVVRVDRDFRVGSKSDVFTSSPFVVSFEASKDVSIGLPNRVNNFRKAELEFKDDTPEWNIQANGKLINYKSEKLPGGAGLFPYSDVEKLLRSYNADNGVLIENGIVSSENELLPASSISPINEQSDNLTQLKLWYTKASKEERKAFRKWVIDQE
ncbi:hypothetical protein RN22_15750 [Grimontia sp. AD028]|uniref:YccT family protein n=1 Tax=Grimontia sp. AD028 TaxID=1581149 RepID=UPI00061AB634|nr:DUF2057 domain-containing protein [Grimontia sp. AD028]KKD59370.1 hypothetical protein RN22_15750 [Grimontia sp. AD028]